MLYVVYEGISVSLKILKILKILIYLKINDSRKSKIIQNKTNEKSINLLSSLYRYIHHISCLVLFNVYSAVI